MNLRMLRVFNSLDANTLLGPALALTLSACSSEKDSEPRDGDEAQSAAYAISSRVLGPEDEVLYVSLAGSLDSGEADLHDALEFPGGASIFGVPGSGVLFVAPYTEPTIERWTLGAGGKLEPDDKVSFANLGVESAATGQVFSHGRAYFLANGELVSWDPERMELLETYPLPEFEYTGEGEYQPGASITALGPDSILIYGHWSDVDEWNRWADHATQVVFDTKTNTVISSFDEPRSEMLEPYGKATKNGDRYFSSDPAYQTDAITYGDEYGSRPVALRMKPDGDRFDDDFFLDMSKLVGGRPAGVLTPVSDDTFFLDVLHSELLEVPLEEPTWWETAPAAYRYWVWHPGDDEATELAEQESRFASTAFQVVVDGKVYVQDHDKEFTSWRLLQLSPDGSVEPGIAGQGYSSEIVKLR